LDCSLVSSKNFSEILPPNGWRLGLGKVGQGGLKVLHLWRHLRKNHTPQAKIFFSSADYKTCWVFWDFYRVCRAYQTGEIPAQSHVHLGVFFENPRKQLDTKVLNKALCKGVVWPFRKQHFALLTILLQVYEYIIRRNPTW